MESSRKTRLRQAAEAVGMSLTKIKPAIVKRETVKKNGEGKIAGKKRSIAWMFFKPVFPMEAIPSKVVCGLCNKISKTPGGTTSGMLCHLRNYHFEDLQLALKGEKGSTTVIKRKRVFSLPVKRVQSQRVSNRRKKVELSRRQSVSSTPHTCVEMEDVMDENERGVVLYEPESEMERTEGLEQESSSMMMMLEVGAEESASSPDNQVVSASHTDEVTKMMVMHLASTSLPLCKVENEYFKKMLWNLNGDYLEQAGVVESGVNVSIVGSVVAMLDTLIKSTKKEIQNKLRDKRLSLSVELWVKSRSEVFVLLVANYLTSEWVLEQDFLGMRKLRDTRLTTPPDELTKTVSQAVNLMIEEYGVKTESLVHLVVHPGQLSLDPFVEIVPGAFSWPCINAIIRASYNLLNEMAQEHTGLDLFGRTLSLAQEQLLECDEDLEAHPGRLVEAVGAKAFYASNGELVQTNRRDLWELGKFQQPFNMMVEFLLNKQPVMLASSILRLIQFVRNYYERRVNSVISSKWSNEHKQDVASKVVSSLENAYGINLGNDDFGGDRMLGVCSFLDPRYKTLRFLTEKQKKVVYDTFRALLHTEEFGEQGAHFREVVGTSIVLVKEEPLAYYEDLNEIISTNNDEREKSSLPLTTELCDMQGSKTRAVGSPPARFRNSFEELEAYINEPAASIETNPFQWWSQNQQRFPKLAALARRYLCIPANATFAKYKFTAAGKQFWDKLGGVEPEYVEKLEILRRYHVTD